MNKAIGGPKTTAFELFNKLNARVKEQTRANHIAVRQTARHKHDGDIEQVFPGPLAMLRQYCGPFALQTSYRQMQLSMYYLFEVLQKPQGREAQPWDATMVQPIEEPGYEWDANGNEVRLRAVTIQFLY